LDGLSQALYLKDGWPSLEKNTHFLQLEPDYWREHWKYAKWVLATAAVFQLTTQGYYWLLASFSQSRKSANSERCIWS